MTSQPAPQSDSKLPWWVGTYELRRDISDLQGHYSRMGGALRHAIAFREAATRMRQEIARDNEAQANLLSDRARAAEGLTQSIQTLVTAAVRFTRAGAHWPITLASGANRGQEVFDMPVALRHLLGGPFYGLSSDKPTAGKMTVAQYKGIDPLTHGAVERIRRLGPGDAGRKSSFPLFEGSTLHAWLPLSGSPRNAQLVFRDAARSIDAARNTQNALGGMVAAAAFPLREVDVELRARVAELLGVKMLSRRPNMPPGHVPVEPTSDSMARATAMRQAPYLPGSVWALGASVAHEGRTYCGLVIRDTAMQLGALLTAGPGRSVPVTDRLRANRVGFAMARALMDPEWHSTFAGNDPIDASLAQAAIDRAREIAGELDFGSAVAESLDAPAIAVATAASERRGAGRTRTPEQVPSPTFTGDLGLRSGGDERSVTENFGLQPPAAPGAPQRD